MKKRFLCLMLVALMFLFNGCWDNREINELGLVTAVGIDKGENGGFSVTVQIANPSTGGGGGESGGSKTSEWINTAQGASLFDAVRLLGDTSSKRIMWAHDGMIVIGESLAREGIIPVVDFFTHSPELRMKTAVAVSQGDAKEYISANAGMDSPSGIAFVNIEAYRALSARSIESHMLAISAHLKSKLGNPLITRIDFRKATEKSQDGGTKITELNSIHLSGAAVFRRDKMVGWLTQEETRGAAWVLNQAQNTVVAVPVPSYQNKMVSVEIDAIKADIKSKIVSGLPHFSVTVIGSGEIVEEDGSTRLDINEAKKQVGVHVSIKVKEEIEKMFAAVQGKYGVDVLEFADIVHAQNPKEWKAGIKDKWEMIFPQIPVIVTVKVDVHGSTLNEIPMNINGSAG